MKLLPFRESAECSIGVELELQIINPANYALISRAKDLIRNIHEHSFQTRIKPEITQSMIEINSSIHMSVKEMAIELAELKNFLIHTGNFIGAKFCGGGTHPFQRWATQKIFPTTRFKNLSTKYRYLSKRATVFGQHIHVGCSNPSDALYLTHAFARYVPQLIAISASSPFYQGVDTGFVSSRVNVFNAFPLSGVIPYLSTWEEFSNYFYLLEDMKIIKSMKDVYWDIRPKPEFGTVEIRTCDTPLTVKKAVMVCAYIQSLALYLLNERPVTITKNLYYLYNTNRFEASRYGYDGDFINADTKKKCTIQEDIIDTVDKIKPYANKLNNMNYISQLTDEVNNKYNDTVFLKKIFKQTNSLSSVAAEQCKWWLSETGDER